MTTEYSLINGERMRYCSKCHKYFIMDDDKHWREMDYSEGYKREQSSLNEEFSFEMCSECKKIYYKERKSEAIDNRKRKQSIKKKRNLYNKIVKRDINISLLRNKQNITAREACIAVSCKPAQNYLDYILETNPNLKLNFSKDELKRRIVLIEKRAFKLNKIILPKITVALVLYHSSCYTYSKIAKICGTCPGTMANYTKYFKSVLKNIKRNEVENESEGK